MTLNRDELKTKIKEIMTDSEAMSLNQLSIKAGYTKTNSRVKNIIDKMIQEGEVVPAFDPEKRYEKYNLKVQEECS